jgi:hypothetical protein
MEEREKSDIYEGAISEERRGLIYFDDFTINEAEGEFAEVNRLMHEDGVKQWMLRSEATIVTRELSSHYLLHFWDNGEVHIVNTTRPPHFGLPDGDIHELNQWKEEHGWNKLVLSNKLIEDPQSFQFWKQKFQMGLIFSEELQLHDEQDMDRMTLALEKENDEDEKEHTIGEHDAN